MIFDKEDQIYTDDNGTQWRIGQRIYLNPAWCNETYNPTPFHLHGGLLGEITKIRAYKNAPVKVHCMMYLRPKRIEFVFPIEAICKTKSKEEIPIKPYDLPLMGAGINEKEPNFDRVIERVKATMFDLIVESPEFKHFPEDHPAIKKFMKEIFQIIFDIAGESGDPNLSIESEKTEEGYNGLFLSIEGDTIVFRAAGDPTLYKVPHFGYRLYGFDPAVTIRLENCHGVIIPEQLSEGNTNEYAGSCVFETGEIRLAPFIVKRPIGAEPIRHNDIIGKMWIPEWPGV